MNDLSQKKGGPAPAGPPQSDPYEIIVKLDERTPFDPASPGAFDECAPDAASILDGELGVLRIVRSFPLLADRSVGEHTRAGKVSLGRFFRFRVPAAAWDGHRSDLVDSMPEVEYMIRSALPALGAEDHSGAQTYYFDATAGGVGAEAVAPIPGAEGWGLRVLLIDAGLDPGHPDLPDTIRVWPDVGTSLVDPMHGTKMCGVMLAPHSNPEVGLKGLVPDAEGYFCSSEEPEAGPVDPVKSSLVSALEEALRDVVDAGGNPPPLRPGDVLVLGLQSRLAWPVDQDIDLRYLIRWASVDRGITVVLPAGNSDEDLDLAEIEPEGLPRVKPWNEAVISAGTWPDSGAVIAGAGHGSGARAQERYVHDPDVTKSSNHGWRVDCQGWGERVVTTTATAGAAYDYSELFNQTSGATAMLGGMVASLQAAYRRATAHHGLSNGEYLAPASIREHLRMDRLGAPQKDANNLSGPAATHRVGPMPNLVRLFEELVPPKLYLRDTLDDDGEAMTIFGPESGDSPDIIIKSEAVPPDWIADGTVDDRSVAVVPGAEHFVYARVVNRGGRLDGGVVHVFSSSASSFFQPFETNRVGRIPVHGVGAGRVGVFGPLRWTPPVGVLGIPPTYMLATLVASSRGPDLLEVARFASEFASQIHTFDYLRYRTVMSAEAVMAPMSGPEFAFMFDMEGHPEEAASYDLELEYALPEGTRVDLGTDRGALELVAAEGGMAEATFGRFEVRAGETNGEREGRLWLRSVPIAARARRGIKLGIVWPGGEPPTEGDFFIRATQYLGEHRKGTVVYRWGADA